MSSMVNRYMSREKARSKPSLPAPKETMGIASIVRAVQRAAGEDS